MIVNDATVWNVFGRGCDRVNKKKTRSRSVWRMRRRVVKGASGCGGRLQSISMKPPNPSRSRTEYYCNCLKLHEATGRERHRLMVYPLKSELYSVTPKHCSRVTGGYRISKASIQ